MYVKSKSTLSESVSESVTRSPIELFWTAKNDQAYVYVKQSEISEELDGKELMGRSRIGV